MELRFRPWTTEFDWTEGFHILPKPRGRVILKAPSSSFKTVHVLPGCFSLISECDGIELIFGQLICLDMFGIEAVSELLLRGTTVQVLQTCGYYNQLYENMISVLVAVGGSRVTPTSLLLQPSGRDTAACYLTYILCNIYSSLYDFIFIITQHPLIIRLTRRILK